MKKYLIQVNLIKAFGKKDISKLTKKTITNKLGHRQTVYVQQDEHKEDNNIIKNWLNYNKLSKKEKERGIHFIKTQPGFKWNRPFTLEEKSYGFSYESPAQPLADNDSRKNI